MTKSDEVILKVENLSKQYRLGLVGTGSLSHDLNRWWHRVRGKEDPYLKIGETNDRSQKGESEYVWALKDINFEVKRGEVLGIIGKNGAGKSTLLKILSKVTSPTTGSVKTRGRIASLLEVGTGFHGEMTGRENIYLNGAILGMTKKEIASKIDEIIDFSGCARYIDTPVKRYSSGMTVRLAFAVAAFLEPDILIVDEVLAVGDAEFQKKAIGKMQDISSGEGRTVLFVSHNMVIIKSICERAILLENGFVRNEGTTFEVVNKYLEYQQSSQNAVFKPSKDIFSYIDLIIYNSKSPDSKFLAEEDGIVFQLKIDILKHLENLSLTLVLKTMDNTKLFTLESHNELKELKHGKNEIVISSPHNFFMAGTFKFDLHIVQNNLHSLWFEEDFISFTVNPRKRKLGDWMGDQTGYIKPKFYWRLLN